MNSDTIIEYLKGATIYDLAKKHNVWPNQVRLFLKQNNIEMRHKGRIKGKLPSPTKGKPSKKKKDTILMIESGEYKKYSECYIRLRMKEYLIIKRGNVCEICNTSKWNKEDVPLVCDHIDGNSLNSDITNFRLVCANCNAQLSTTGSRNRGQGRRYDIERYHRIKSQRVA